jgi:hypothetical protein
MVRQVAPVADRSTHDMSGGPLAHRNQAVGSLDVRSPQNRAMRSSTRDAPRLLRRSNTRSPADTRAECCSPMRAARSAWSHDRRKSRGGPPNGDNGSQDRPDPAAMPHYNFCIPGECRGNESRPPRLCDPSATERDSAARIGSGTLGPPIRDHRRRARAATTRKGKRGPAVAKRGRALLSSRSSSAWLRSRSSCAVGTRPVVSRVIA